MFCLKCGAPVPEGSQVCTSCGSQLNVQESNSNSAEQPFLTNTEPEQQTVSAGTAPIPNSNRKISGTLSLLGSAFKVFGKSWFSLISVGLLSTVVVYSANFFGFLLGYRQGSFIGDTNSLVVFIVIMLVAGIFALLLSLLQAKIVFNAGNNNNEDVGSLVVYSFKNLWPYFLTTLSFGLALGVGFILLAIPGVLVLVWYGLFMPIFVLEGKKITDSFKRSHELTKGYFWPIFGRFLLLGILIMVFNFIFSFIPFGTLITPIVYTPLLLAFVYFIYRDLVAIKG